MANSAQAKKRARQSELRRQRNASQRTLLRTRIKNTLKAIQAGEKTTAESTFKEAVPVIDRMARKGLIHTNKAARHKSRLNQQIRAMA